MMPCSGGSAFVLFVLSLFQTWHLCSIEEGQMDWSAEREKRGNSVKSPTAVRENDIFHQWIEDDKEVGLLRGGNLCDITALMHSVQHMAFTLQWVHIQSHSTRPLLKYKHMVSWCALGVGFYTLSFPVLILVKSWNSNSKSQNAVVINWTLGAPFQAMLPDKALNLEYIITNVFQHNRGINIWGTYNFQLCVALSHTVCMYVFGTSASMSSLFTPC